MENTGNSESCHELIAIGFNKDETAGQLEKCGRLACSDAWGNKLQTGSN